MDPRCVSRRGLATLIVLSACGPNATPPPAGVATIAKALAPPTEPPPPPPRFDAVRPAADYLTDDIGERERRRARLRSVPPFTWRLRSEPTEPPDHEGNATIDDLETELVVVEEHPDQLRVVFDEGRLQVSFYVGRDHNLHEVPVRATTLLDRDASAFANGCGVTVPAGTVLELEPERLGFRRASLNTNALLARGGVSAGAIGRVYRAPPEPASTVVNCELAAPVDLLDGARGRHVVRLVGEASYECTLEGRAPTRAGRRQLSLLVDGVTVRGFAPASAITEVAPHERERDGRFGGLGLWGTSNPHFLYLWPGDAILRAEGDHEQIGRVIGRAFKVNEVAQESGLTMVNFPVAHWSFMDFAVTREARAAALTKHAAWLSRVQFHSVLVTGGGATVDKVTALLEEQRESLNECFDEALRELPGTTFAYAIEATYASDRPDPKLVASAVTQRELEGCLRAYLREREPAGTTVTFTLTLTPSPVVDSPPR